MHTLQLVPLHQEDAVYFAAREIHFVQPILQLTILFYFLYNLLELKCSYDKDYAIQIDKHEAVDQSQQS